MHQLPIRLPWLPINTGKPVLLFSADEPEADEVILFCEINHGSMIFYGIPIYVALMLTKQCIQPCHPIRHLETMSDQYQRAPVDSQQNYPYGSVYYWFD